MFFNGLFFVKNYIHRNNKGVSRGQKRFHPLSALRPHAFETRKHVLSQIRFTNRYSNLNTRYRRDTSSSRSIKFCSWRASHV